MRQRLIKADFIEHARQALPAGEPCEDGTHDGDGNPILGFPTETLKWQWKTSTRDAHNMQGFLPTNKATADVAANPGRGLRAVVPSDSLDDLFDWRSADDEQKSKLRLWVN